MDIVRIIGIGIVMIIPVFVGAGALWDIFHSWIVVCAWILIVFGVPSGFVVWKLLAVVQTLLSPNRFSHRVVTMVRKSPGVILGEIERSPLFYVWLSILAAAIFLAGYALLASLFLSMEILEFSIKIPWATLVSSYTWLVVAGSGLCIINGLGAVFGMHRYEMMTKRITFLSLISIIFGLIFILLHLGRPERVLVYNLISPNFRSAISWMGALYNIYIVIVVLEFWMLIRSDLVAIAERAAGIKRATYFLIALKKPDDAIIGRYLSHSRIGCIFDSPTLERFLNHPMLFKIIGTFAFVIGVAALTMLGSVFAHTESRALWYGAYYPVYFLISALFTGYALLIAVTIITYRAKNNELPPQVKDLLFEMCRVLAFLLAVGLALTAFRLSTGLFDPEMQGAVMVLLKGPFTPAFWGFEVGLMSVIPAFVLLWSSAKEKLNGALIGAVMVLIGAFVMRYDFVVGGQVFPNVRERLPSYLPTLMECFIIFGIISAFLLVYSLGEKFLPLKEESLNQA